MAIITVFSFTIYNPKIDKHERASGMCTEEMILKNKDATIIRSEYKIIDDSELTQSGRYYLPSQD